jgi:ABC-2 type transport system ATP-binding protein/ribosome-dependent ATPase
MVGGRVAADGTVAGVIGGRTVVEVTCNDWRRAFAVLDAAGLVVQLQGDVLRVPGSPRQVEDLLAQHSLEAALTTVPANLEEAFVSVVSGGPRR